MKSVSDGEKFPVAKLNTAKKNCGENSDDKILSGKIVRGDNIMRRNLT